jgi:predicted methyltransferase
MYEQSKLSELIRFARVDASSTVIDVYPGDGDWTRLFSDIVGPNVEIVSADLIALAEARQPADVVWMHCSIRISTPH